MTKKASHPPAAALRLLLVDDNCRGLIARKVVLEEQGYQVTTCNSPEVALTKFRSEDYDVVVCDYRMPNMNGVELLSAMRAVRPVPAVLVSGVVEVLGLNESNTGADAVIAKNSHEIANMVRAVNRLAAGKGRKPARKPAGKHSSSASRKKASGE